MNLSWCHQSRTNSEFEYEFEKCNTLPGLILAVLHEKIKRNIHLIRDLPGVMKTALVYCLLIYVGFVVVVVLWLGICVEVAAVDRVLPFSIYTPPFLPSHPPSPPPWCFFFFRSYPQILSLTQVTVLFEISVCLKLVSVPFSRWV